LLDIGLRPGVRGEVADLREQVEDRRHREGGETDLNNRFGGQPRGKTPQQVAVPEADGEQPEAPPEV
jgi:hypothetical protein